MGGWWLSGFRRRHALPPHPGRLPGWGRGRRSGGRSPVCFEPSEHGAVVEAAVGGIARELCLANFGSLKSSDAGPTIEIRAADDGPEREPARRLVGFRTEAEGERALAAEQQHAAEKVQLLRSHLGEAV